MNSLTCTEHTPKLVQLNGCLCPCFDFQICCEAPQRFWRLLETTNCWKLRHEWYPLLIHVPLLCLVVHYISEDIVSISSPRELAQFHFITLAFLKWWKILLMLLPQYSILSRSVLIPQQVTCVGCLQTVLFYFHGTFHSGLKKHISFKQGWSAQKDEEILKWLIQNSKEKSQTSSRAHSRSLFFLALRYLLEHSLILQMVGRPLLY